MALISRVSGSSDGGSSSGSSTDLLEINLLGALEYRRSVIEGIGEFITYLADRRDRCPAEVFLVGGYSQGAQVISRSLSLLAHDTRDRIAHVALFSDPTLHLPEGEDPAFVASCAQGIPVTVSAWRRGNVGCSTIDGILNLDGLEFLNIGSRARYVPPDIEARVGSWCERTDGVCTGSFLDLILGVHFDVESRRFHVPIHGVYTDKYFGEAAGEAAALVVEAPE